MKKAAINFLNFFRNEILSTKKGCKGLSVGFSLSLHLTINSPLFRMKKAILFLYCIIFISCNLFAATNLFSKRPVQTEPSPLSVLSSKSDRESWCENEDYAFINGYGNLHYWLYDSYKYHNGDISELLEKIVPDWFQNALGYSIDRNYKVYSQNNKLAPSVKKLMNDYNSNVSVTFYYTSKNGDFASVSINSYDRKSGSYTTYAYSGKKTRK